MSSSRKNYEMTTRKRYCLTLAWKYALPVAVAAHVSVDALALSGPAFSLELELAALSRSRVLAAWLACAADSWLFVRGERGA